MVRFADGPTTEVSLEIAAPAETLWPILTDISLPVESSDELQSVEWLTGDAPALGAVFKGHNGRGESRWTTESTITEFEPPRRYSWTVGDVEDAIASWGFELQALSPASTRVRQWCRLGPGRSGVTWAIKQNPDAEDEIIAARLGQLQSAMRLNLEVVAQRAGAATPGDDPGTS